MKIILNGCLRQQMTNLAENSVVIIMFAVMLIVCKYLLKFQKRWNKICKLLGVSTKTDPQMIYEKLENMSNEKDSPE